MSLLATVFIFLVALTAVLLVRKESLRKNRALARVQVPSAMQLSWAREDEMAARSLSYVEATYADGALTSEEGPLVIGAVNAPSEARHQGQSTYVSSVADGLLSGLPVLEAVRHIDPSVLDAIKESTATHIHGLPSIHDYVTQHFFDAPTQTADGWFERLTGYVAEQKAASALEAAGHHVTFAATSNQPVWDLLVDGHPVQIKEGISGVRSFLLEHHDVHIYTGEQVASTVKDPLVHGLKGLDSSQIHELTHQSVDGISDVFDPSFHFPLITLAFSSYRETKLLIAYKTSFQRAAKNIGMDVVGVGACSFAGAKAGALIGAFFTPAGAAAGALAGGVAGGIGGKLASNKFRYEPFKRAVADFGEWSARTESAVNTAVFGTRDGVKILEGTSERKFSTHKEQLNRESLQKLASVRSAFEASFIAFADAFIVFLDELESRLEKDETAVLQSLPNASWRVRFWPTAQDHVRFAIFNWFAKARDIVSTERALISTAPRTLEGKREAIVRFTQTYRFDGADLNGHLAVLFQEYLYAQDEARFIQRTAEAELSKNRDSLIHRFGNEVASIYEGLTQTIREWNDRMKLKKEALQREAAAVGIDL